MNGANMGSSLPHSKELDCELKHRRDADPGSGTQLGSCLVANPWLPSEALQCLQLLLVKEAAAPTSLLGLLGHPGRETKHSSFPTNLEPLCPYPTTPPKAGHPT